MKKMGSQCQGRFRNFQAAVVAGLTLVLIFSAGIAFGSAGGEGGPKGWVNTDTFRVINFLLLAGALFFLLKKPVAQALSGRIDGIRVQLEELEAKKTGSGKIISRLQREAFQDGEGG